MTRKMLEHTYVHAMSASSANISPKKKTFHLQQLNIPLVIKAMTTFISIKVENWKR